MLPGLLLGLWSWSSPAGVASPYLGAHVANKSHLPGYQIAACVPSKFGAPFVASDGGKIHNIGEVLLSLICLDSNGTGHAANAHFQIADVRRPVWSVCLICDSGLQVTFAAR